MGVYLSVITDILFPLLAQQTNGEMYVNDQQLAHEAQFTIRG